MANDGSIKSLKDIALVLPKRLISVAGDPYLGMSLTLLKLTPATGAAAGEYSGSSSSPLHITEARYLWFHKRIRWEG